MERHLEVLQLPSLSSCIELGDAGLRSSNPLVVKKPSFLLLL